MPKPENESESFAALFEASRKAPGERRLAPGDDIDVIVVRVGRDAVFVEVDGKQEGFIEAKELTNASGAMTVAAGSRLRARVVEIGGRAGAIRLVPLSVRSHPQGEAVAEGSGGAVDLPIDSPHNVLAVGARVKGTVASVERYGVFLNISTGGAGATGRDRPSRGLIPVAELGLPRGADLRKAFPPGKPLEAKIIAIDEQGRVRLSVVQLAADEERAAFTAFASQAKQKDDERRGAERAGFGTLGDLWSSPRAQPPRGKR